MHRETRSSTICMEVAVCVVHLVLRTRPAYGPPLESAPPLITHAKRLRHTALGVVCLQAQLGTVRQAGSDVITYRTMGVAIAC